MTKLSRKKLDPADFGYYINNLWSAFTLANSKEDIKLLFKDLFTHTEYKMFAKRFETARRLISGQSYEQITDALKLTPGTIAKVNNILSEKGEGLRKADKNLLRLESKQLESEQEFQKNLENPFRLKLKRKTLAGELLKAGVKALDKKISQKLKQNTAKKILSI